MKNLIDFVKNSRIKYYVYGYDRIKEICCPITAYYCSHNKKHYKNDFLEVQRLVNMYDQLCIKEQHKKKGSSGLISSKKVLKILKILQNFN